MSKLTELAEALADLNKEHVNNLVETKLKAGVAPLEIINELNTGITEVGDRFAAGEYFLSELMYSSHIMKEIMTKLGPLSEIVEPAKSAGKVIIGTVKGDIHDIGKNIVVTLLRGAGFEVSDLGVDVPANAFVQKAKETGANILGLSALLNLTLHEMRNVVDAIVAAGIRNQVKIIIGGAPCNEQVREYTGADYFAPDAPSAVRICREIYS